MGTILGMNLSNANDTVIAVAGSLYVKTPAALETLLAELRGIGYEIDDLREAEYRTERGTSIEAMEKRGLSLWFAKLDVTRGKCKACGGYISTRGIKAHGHTCELCGAVTYLQIIDGTTVRFSFIEREEERMGMADVKLTAKRWDTKEGYLYFYPEVLDGLWLHGERAQQYLDANKDKWEEVTEEGVRLIRIKYPHPWNYDVAAINPSEIHGHYWGHEIVKVWEGKEYAEFLSDFPLRETISIYESWHWAPHKKSRTLHSTILHACGHTADKGWHYQDGSPWFRPGHWQNMSTYIRHFTELDADAFDRAWPRFRSDGPGGIDDLARFCSDNPVIENRPNIGNLLMGYGKIAAGKSLTGGELRAMHRAGSDKAVGGQFFDFLRTQAKARTQNFTSPIERKLRNARTPLAQRRSLAREHGYNVIRKYRGCRENKRLVEFIFWNPTTKSKLHTPAL